MRRGLGDRVQEATQTHNRRMHKGKLRGNNLGQNPTGAPRKSQTDRQRGGQQGASEKQSASRGQKAAP